jgi:Ca2+-binding RTX toxin-like protein
LGASESGLPTGTVYSYSVQWGDGSSVQTLSGPSGAQVTHGFLATGVVTITVTATDPKGNLSSPVSTSVSLSSLLLETDPYNSSLTALYVGGTTGNDNIAITPVAGGGVKLGMNLVNYGSFSPTGHVVVYGLSGNDVIKTAAQTINGVLTYVNVPVMFFAGSGNDVLNVMGSSANNVLVGGGGTVRLIGGQGRDILIGGAGQATLQAGAGGDILIGGTTAFDNNAAALAAVLAEWGRTDIDYTTRMSHLNGSLSGGLNGAYYLNTSTVHGNSLADNLYGGAGMDWYLAGLADVFFNKSAGEVVSSI